MKRAQMKMGETIAVLVVFFMLIMVGLVIYTGMREDSIARKMEVEQELKGVEIATRVSQLPDIRCDRSMCIGCTDAIDILKLESFVEDMDIPGNTYPSMSEKYRGEYHDMFQESTITINLVYPDPHVGDFFGTYPEWAEGGAWDFEKRWVIYNQTGEMESYKPVFIPINLYNAFSEECYMGVMNVSVYEP